MSLNSAACPAANIVHIKYITGTPSYLAVMYHEMIPPCRESITESSPNILALGTMVNCIRAPLSTPPAPNTLLSWHDEDFIFHLLPRGRSTANLINSSPQLQDSLPMHELIYDAGSCSGVYFLGKEIVCKVKGWKEGMQLECQTIAFVREHFPTIPVPEILYSWIDKSINRSFDIMKRVHARTLDKAWADLTPQQRLNIAEQVAGRTLPPYSAAEYRDYAKRISTAPPPEFDDDFVFYHDDQGPTNILVSDDGDSVAAIIDWENAAFYPRYWVATVQFAHAGFLLEPPKGQRRFEGDDEWGLSLVAALKQYGFDDCKEAYKAWSKGKAEDVDTEKDLAEWRKILDDGYPYEESDV
ncbi:hypothetical protein D6D12_05392 [Aureobasidium pullulans]|uniref:Aminoglycoside phosphotransferase domain-containing protein n=1 Tax=Aureobasidium pullulans TaxID=5580 RepID=A0AB74JRW7_AURPU|nr:hypothetical protein D6D12_05392 [Aureobasidium pullulans]THX45684.1 hypothetical protein D6D11_07245 [Aureobasidium pullulans]THX55316.1 hypothetical protein D6D08_09386 [Aureobasidium pullulans]